MTLGNATILFGVMVAALIGVAESTPSTHPIAHILVVSTNKADRLPVLANAICSGETWPNLTTACLRYANGDQGIEQARTIVR